MPLSYIIFETRQKYFKPLCAYIPVALVLIFSTLLMTETFELLLTFKIIVHYIKEDQATMH